MTKKDIKNNERTDELKKFRKLVLSIYKKHRRDSLPWRNTTDPYAILVSEIMLQQTQVERVIPKYTAWIKRFPTAASVHVASQKEILTYWQGLGYNRRALFLKKTCDEVVQTYKGVFPTEYQKLLKLPGVGQSTAGAIMNFAFNIPQPFIETNIRTIFLHHFFKKISLVPDIKILELVDSTINTKNPRDWFYALYDYGTILKKELGRKKTGIHKQSKHYNKQSKFEGSDRQIRGAILRHLLQKGAEKWNSFKNLTEVTGIPQGTPPSKIENCLSKLVKEGLITYSEKKGEFAIL